MLTFKEIKEKCVPGETKLYSARWGETVYVGISPKGEVVTLANDGSPILRWSEEELRHWSLTPPKKKVKVAPYLYVAEKEINNGMWLQSPWFVDDASFLADYRIKLKSYRRLTELEIEVDEE